MDKRSEWSAGAWPQCAVHGQAVRCESTGCKPCHLLPSAAGEKHQAQRQPYAPGLQMHWLPDPHLCYPRPHLLQEKNIKHNGNLTLEDVYEVARVMRDRSCAATFAGTVKEMLGSCVSGEGGDRVACWVGGPSAVCTAMEAPGTCVSREAAATYMHCWWQRRGRTQWRWGWAADSVAK